MKKILLISLALFTSLSCTKKIAKIKHTVLVRKEAKGLSEEIAKERKLSISNLTYLFEVDLKDASKSSTFSGSSTVIFDFDKDKFFSKELSLDFEGGTVTGLLINGKKEAYKQNNFFITFGKDLLAKGKNTIKVFFEHEFSKTGSGLYKFKDETDGSTYVYTDFEPYDANQFAPMFDQPNLKATYSLNVQAPPSWTVLTSVKEQMVSDKKTFKIWSFPPSQKFSTYIFSLHGGPYKEWTDKVKLKTKEIELRLFARKSLSKFVKPDFWFKITKQGFNFFEQYFSTEYPYTKYDQVLVPDFNSGAMENVAAVTFNELYISREGTAPRSQRRRLANVIFHEMAHMWFGNLVTMDWWNDLWLNESFATYMANTGLYYNTEFTEIWTNFNTRTKQWAYSEDRWRTTHPIEAEIPSTSEATASFDGITYGKGASTLKQLVFLIGEENFKRGLADYFKAYAEKNTLRKNFIDSLQAHTKEDLSSWTKEWLQTKGLNSLESNIKCSDNKLRSIDFVQGVVSGDQKLRTHKLKLALWLSSNPTSPDLTEEIKISGKKTKWTSKKEIPCPKAVFPNWEDHAYIQVNLDKASQTYFETNVSKVKSNLFRAQFWSMLKTKFVHGQLHPEKILPLVKTHLPNETNADEITTLLKLTAPYRAVSRLGSPKPNIFTFYSDSIRAKKDRGELSDLLEKSIAKNEQIDAKKTLFNNWLTQTFEDSPEKLANCLKSKCDFETGFRLDPDRKWLILLHLAAVKHKSTGSLLTNLEKSDSSRRAQLFKTSAEASLAKNKIALVEKALGTSSKLSLKERNAIITGLIPVSQRSDHLELIDDTFFKKIESLSGLPTRVQKTFTTIFSPLSCGEHKSDNALTEKFIKDSSWNFSVKKALLQSLDREERCLKIKELSKQKEA